KRDHLIDRLLRSVCPSLPSLLRAGKGECDNNRGQEMSSVEMPTIGRVPVSVAGVGCNNFGRRIDEERSHAVVAAALDAGINVFDTAESYGDGRSEEFLGRALGSRRDAAVIVTKFSFVSEERATVDGLAR